MRTYIKLLLAGVLLLVPMAARAQYERPGSTTAQFLKIGVHARASAMGDAYIAMPEGAEAVYYNPAGLAHIERTAASFGHTALYASINHDFAAVAHTFGNLGTVGVSATALYTDPMKVRTPLQPDGTGETFRTVNYRVGVSYSRMLTDRVSFGTTVNYVGMDLYADLRASAVSADIATLYVSDFRGFRFGMMISNFGSNLRFVNEDYPLPTTFTFGGGINAIDGRDTKLLLSTSAVKPNDGKPLAQVGAEWSFRDLLHLRAGYRPSHSTASYSFGGGLSTALGKGRISGDYAYSSFDLLGTVHRFTIDISL